MSGVGERMHMRRKYELVVLRITQPTKVHAFVMVGMVPDYVHLYCECQCDAFDMTPF